MKANVASSIEMALKKRSTLEDLVDSGIIPLDAAVVSPTLASSADMLSRYLQKRPTADDLRERGILKTGGVVAEQKEKVVKKGVAAALEGSLRRRPSLVEMEDKNMMKAEAKPADILCRSEEASDAERPAGQGHPEGGRRGRGAEGGGREGERGVVD